jgi:hypothetical protein
MLHLRLFRICGYVSMQSRLQNVHAEKNGAYGGTLGVRAISKICKGSVSVYFVSVGHIP